MPRRVRMLSVHRNELAFGKMDLFRKYLGAQQGDQLPSGVETVERLCERVRTSTLLDDRRDAVRALKSLSKKFQLEVGSIALDILTTVLETDRADTEILGYVLETLCNIMCNEPLDDDDDGGVTRNNLPENMGTQFTDMFIKNHDNVALLLSLLEEYDFHVRWPTVRLITLLLINKCKPIQEVILANPLGISKLMDVLADSREIIRNDGLLLLLHLTKNSTNIQKIVAFENAFEGLLNIINEEGTSDGGIVVEDCLHLMLNLLKNNSSNQNFFKEGSFTQRLAPFFELESTPSEGWSAQKVTNIQLMLQMLRSLVSPGNPQQQTADFQKVMHRCGLLEKLCHILMASGVPADVLTESINTVSEVIRGCPTNQEYFASVMAPSNPPRPALVVLLLSMVNEKQPFMLRCAVLYCFQSFLHKNELGQSQIIQTLLPTTTEVNTISAGQLLCGGLFSIDPLSTWFAAVALLHAVNGNTAQKEQLLRVQLATSLGNPPVSLLQQCANILAQGPRVLTRVGLLMLLCHWLADCPIAVTHFLHNSANVPFLISQVSASEGDELELVVQALCAFLLGLCVLYNDDQVENCQRNALRQVIEKRIGLELFTDKLSQVAKHESYNVAAKKPQVDFPESADIVIDHQFTRLFKKLEGEVQKAVSPVQQSEVDAQKKQAVIEQHDSIVSQYKELIREQDAQLNTVRAELSEMKAKYSNTDVTLEELTRQIQQLKDQNALLKAHRGSGASMSPDRGSGDPDRGSGDPGELSRLEQEIHTQKREIEEKNEQIEKLKQNLSNGSPCATPSDTILSNHTGDSLEGATDGNGTVALLETDVAELNKKIAQKDEEVKLYKGRYEDTSKYVAELRKQLCEGDTPDGASSALLQERSELLGKISALEESVKTLQAENERLSAVETNSRTATEENHTLKAQVLTASEAQSAAETQLAALKTEVESLTKEQDDLLVLLAEQDTKMKAYRKRLKELGETIEDDDDDDDVSDDFEDEDIED